MEDDPQFCETLEFETQTDILTLLENVKCQGCNPSILHQALNALATIFCTITDSQDYFRLVGGLDVLTDLLVEGHCPLIAVPGVLYCLACAVKQNVTSQNIVLSNPVLKVLHCLLSESESDSKILQSASFLLACVVSGSGKGQSLAYETQCLQDLLNLLRNCVEERCIDDNKWSVVTKAIGVCVNNPQNDKYQQVCCSVLPHVLKFLCDDPEHESVRHILFLLGLVVSNNASNQERIRKCGGVEILITFIKKQLYSSLATPDHKLLASGVAALDACIAENEKSGKQAEKLGIIPVILDVLDKRDLDQNETQVVVLTLAHVLESTKEYCPLFSEGRGYSLLVNILTETQDEELFKTIKYILTISKTTDFSHKQNCDKLGLESRKESKHDNLVVPSNELSSLATKKCNALLDQLDSLGNLTNLLSFLGQSERTDEPSSIDRQQTNHRDFSKLYLEKPFRCQDFNSDRGLKFHRSTSSKHSTGGEAQRVYHKSHTLDSKFSPGVSLPQNECKANGSNEEYRHQCYYKKPNLSLPNVMEQQAEDDESSLGYNRTNHNTNESQNHPENYRKYSMSSTPSFQNTGKRKDSHCHREITDLKDRHSKYSKKENYQHLHINSKHSNLSMPQSVNENTSIHSSNDNVTCNHMKEYFINGNRKGTRSNKYFNLRNNFPNPNTSLLQDSLHSPRHRYKDINTDLGSCTGRRNELSVSPSNQSADDNPGASQCCSPVPSQNQHQSGDDGNEKIERAVNSSLLKPPIEISAGESQTNISMNPLYIVGQLHQTLSNFLTSLSLFTPKLNMNSDNKAESSAITLIHTEPKCDDTSENFQSTTSNVSINKDLTAGNKASPPELNLAGKDFNNGALNSSYSSQGKCNEMLTTNKVVEKDDLTMKIMADDTTLSKELSSTKITSPPKHCNVTPRDLQDITLGPKTGNPRHDDNLFLKPSQTPVQHTPSSFKKRTMNIRYAQTQRRTSPPCHQPVTSTTCTGLQIPPSPALSEFDQALKLLANKKRKQHSKRSLIDCSETSGISSLMSDHTENVSTLGIKGHSSHGIKRHGSHDSNNSGPAQVIPSLSLHGIRTKPKTPRFKDSEIHNIKLSTPLNQVSQSKGRKTSLNGVHSVNSLCPGCKSGSDLNSRTFNIAIETSAYTCSYHRSLRQQEREFIKKIVQNKKPEAPCKEKGVISCSENDVYHFTSESEKSDVSVCPDVSLTSVRNALKKRQHLKEHRRPRIAYSDQEIQNLIEGVSKMGTCWHQILCTYEFHPIRTAVDLKDKYKRLMKTGEEMKSKHRRSQKPFSMCESRRLKRGVKTFGYNWKAILAEGKFLPGRTSSDLRDKWRQINKAY